MLVISVLFFSGACGQELADASSRKKRRGFSVDAAGTRVAVFLPPAVPVPARRPGASHEGRNPGKSHARCKAALIKRGKEGVAPWRRPGAGSIRKRFPAGAFAFSCFEVSSHLPENIADRNGGIP